MKQMKRQTISWLLVLAMAFSLILPGNVASVQAETAPTGYVYLTVEKTTIGQGLIQEPIKVSFSEGDKISDILQYVLGAKAVIKDSQYGLYLSSIKDGGNPEGWTISDVPGEVKTAVETDTWGNTWSGTRAAEDTLSEVDYAGYAGWMVSVNDQTMTDEGDYITIGSEVKNGDVVRVQFSLTGGSDIESCSWGPIVEFQDELPLIKAVADYEGAITDTKYQNAISVLSKWKNTKAEVDAAINSFNHASERAACTSYLKKALGDNPTFGSEWNIMTIARDGVKDVDLYHQYYANVAAYVEENGSAKLDAKKVTENARLVIALSAIGEDVTDVGGFDLLEPFADFDYVKKQGLNGSVYTLIALDCRAYEIPAVAEGGNQTTRENLIAEILGKQLAGGGWTFFGDTADPDMTGMAIQALAPYYDSNADVKSAVDKALSVLSAQQKEDGGFASLGSLNSESCAQVVCALSALGKNADTDVAFVKNGYSVLDAMLSFYDAESGGFKHTADGDVNGMASQQAGYALVAYNRVVNKSKCLYDMSDVPNHMDVKQTTKVESEPTCTQAGISNVSITCNICDREIYKGDDIEIKASGHKFKFIARKDATCTEPGNSGYNICENCHKMYRDKSGETKLTEKDTVIPAAGHKEVADAAVAATATTPGKMAGSHCSVCNTVIKAQEVIPATGEAVTVVPEKGSEVVDTTTGTKYEVVEADKKTVAFAGTENATAKKVTIPKTVTIGDVTYAVTKIDAEAFKDNKTVTNVTIDTNITEIGKDAFKGATNLQTVSVGKNVKAIGANAFNGCKKLKTITIKSANLTSKTVAKNAFKGLTKKTTIKVPKKKLNDYKKLFKKKGLSKNVKVKAS